MEKDLLELVAEMLVKQDKHTDILKEFVEVSTKQWEGQQSFNEKVFEELKSMNLKLTDIKELLGKLIEFEDRIKRLERMEERVLALEKKI